ncbi:hypothetical protein Rifp1Sym_ae00300 [endosymbiont of Riftia pachyptila (vent Ph05)]|uniref:Uncharacterized protein n=1 Tax=endosymbiont of Riftia pachyptila (vent Ph05) TaxID=1048808 RepID=G2D9T1_9GAMM|nr:hypothetical protein Rifp1Sym_ae00300 [endosymbiont of Riftia pachyptila (vent Ph05)]
MERNELEAPAGWFESECNRLDIRSNIICSDVGELNI